MKFRHGLTCIVFVLLASLWAQADKAAADMPDVTPAELGKAIDEGIAMLKAGEAVKFLERFVAPDDRKKIAETPEAWRRVVEEFPGEKATELAKVLAAIRDTTPKMLEDGTIAEFQVPEGLGIGRPIRFQLVKKTWYIRN